MTDGPKPRYETPPKDDPHYASVGRVAGYWAILESLIDGAIAHLALCETEAMTCVTAHLIGPAKRMDALIALSVYRGGSNETRKELKAYQGRIQQLGEDRNRVVHDPLYYDTATGQIYRAIATAKGELKMGLEPVSREQMDTVGDRIEVAIDDFKVLSRRLDKEMTAQLLKQLERSREAPRDRNPPDGSPSGSSPPVQ